MSEINLEIFNKHVATQYDTLLRLTKYILEVQGTESKRLDFTAAAQTLGVDWKTIKRACDKLAKANVIIYEGDGLRLSDGIAKEAV